VVEKLTSYIIQYSRKGLAPLADKSPDLPGDEISKTPLGFSAVKQNVGR